MNKLILFDIDKTLINEMERTHNPWKVAFKEVYGIDSEISISKGNTHGMTHKEIAIETLKNKGISENEIKKKLGKFVKTLEKTYSESLKSGKVTTFPKIPELLTTLSEHGHILGLITGNTKKIAFAKLKKAGIDSYFSIGGFGEDSSNREDLVKKAIIRAKKRFKEIKKENIIIIGDTPKDISAAKKFNIKTIGVATGIFSMNDLKKSGADYILPNLQNIKQVTKIIENSLSQQIFTKTKLSTTSSQKSRTQQT